MGCGGGPGYGLASIFQEMTGELGGLQLVSPIEGEEKQLRLTADTDVRQQHLFQRSSMMMRHYMKLRLCEYEPADRSIRWYYFTSTLSQARMPADPCICATSRSAQRNLVFRMMHCKQKLNRQVKNTIIALTACQDRSLRRVIPADRYSTGQ
jgi:hypothetical protein